MRVLVTGGAGFIGSFICEHLLALNHDVIALDDLSLGRERNVEHLLASKNFELHVDDILNESAFAALFKRSKFDCIFHLAANSDIAKSYTSPGVDLNRTFMTTALTLEAARRFDIGQIIFASTSAVYGETKGRVAESHGPLLPISHYGAAKLASEAFVSSYAENYGISAWITRFPNVVGPRATHGAVFDFVKKLKRNPSALEVLGDGNQIKPYLYVEDLVKAILFIWENTSDRVNLYNIGVDSRTSVADIARIVIEESGTNARIEYTGGSRGWIGDVPNFEYDTSALKRLGWKADLTSDEAVRAAARALWQEAE